ncbi:RNA-binding protein cp29b, chloroplastic [Dionaea muscipula]
MAATSLSVSAFTARTHSLSNSKPLSSPSRYSLPKLTPKVNPLSSLPLSISPSFPASNFALISSRFARNFAISSGIEEGEAVGNGAEEPSFSADLKLFVGNLPFSVDSARLAELFQTAGSVEMVEVIYDKVSGRSRGFGFVTMSTVEEAEAAARQFNGYEFEGRSLRVNAGPPPPRTEGYAGGQSGGGSSYGNNNRIHVGNLSWGVDDLALKTLFSEHGEVVEARVVYERESGRSRGFGFVTYTSAQDVDNAIETLDGAELLGRSIRVSHAEARPRRQF